MSILVTGGAGFIGSHLCEALLNKGEHVVCVDDFNDYYNPRFKESNLISCLRNKNFKLFKIDITYIKDLKSVFEKTKIEKIVHLAARTGIRNSISNPEIYEKVNVHGTSNMLILAKKFSIKNFIFGSSSSIYGDSKIMPCSENQKIDWPLSPYAATKRSAELICHSYSHLYNIPMLCLRFFSVYGPRGRPDMAQYKFTESINMGKEIYRFGDGKSMRDYTYIGDIIDGIMIALNKEYKFEIINLGKSEPIELKELINIIENTLMKSAIIKEMPHHVGEALITHADIRKAIKLLNWKPKIKIEEGIRNFVEWYKNERSIHINCYPSL